MHPAHVDPDGLAACFTSPRYRPRSTQSCDAVAIVRDAWASFVERIELESSSLPGFVRDELEGFAGCGDFARGFVVAQCAQCGDGLRVPFSSKSRGICPSCMGRRMGESAALLVDHRLPAVPWRQWVLSFQGPMAVRLGYDTQLLTLVCRRFAKHVMKTLRRATKQAHRLRSSAELHAGILIVVQRFRSDVGLYVHLHALVPDGCFVAEGPSAPLLPLRDLTAGTRSADDPKVLPWLPRHSAVCHPLATRQDGGADASQFHGMSSSKLTPGRWIRSNTSSM